MESARRTRASFQGFTGKGVPLLSVISGVPPSRD
jgi:hypothetical protein